MEFVTLMGANAVKSAGNKIATSAHEMIITASYINESLLQHRIFMDDWLCRFEEILKNRKPSINPCPIEELKWSFQTITLT